MLRGRLKQNTLLDEDGGARSSSQLVCCSPAYIDTHIHSVGESVPMCLSFCVRRRERENESMCDVYL